MSEIAQYGVYFRSTSLKMDAGADGPAIGKTGLSVGKRVFRMSALAFTSYRELRADGKAWVRHGLGVDVQIQATSTTSSVELTLGAVAAQVSVNGASANSSQKCVGTGEFVEDVAAVMPSTGPFDAAVQASLQTIVNKILPDAISPTNSSGRAPTHAFGPFESELDANPDSAQLVVFACEQLALGRTFKEVYQRARKRFGVDVDHRPLEHVFQALGCRDLSAATSVTSQELAYRWIDDVDDLVTDLIQENK